MTVAAIPYIAMAVGAVAQASSAAQQSSAAKNAYSYQAEVSRNNAKIAEWNAQEVARQGEQELIAQRRKTAALAGTQRATLAGRGLDMSEGSALSILTDTDYFGEQDAITIQDNTAKQVWQSRVQAYNDTNNANLMQGRSNSENPLRSAGTSLLTSAGQVASHWLSYSQNKTTEYPGADYGSSKLPKFYA